MESSNKNELRNKYKKIRKEIINKKVKSNIIFEKIINNEFYKNSKVIAIYKNLPDEVDTFKIIEYSLLNGKTVVLPKVIVNNKLKFYKINNQKDLIKNKFGIFEPQNKDSNLFEISNIDLFIVPGICFDKLRNRVGFGRGYYDYCLADSECVKIGICFDEQISDEIIDSQEFDVKMNLVVTDKREIKN